MNPQPSDDNKPGALNPDAPTFVPQVLPNGEQIRITINLSVSHKRY